jgi:hypothetical protein
MAWSTSGVTLVLEVLNVSGVVRMFHLYFSPSTGGKPLGYSYYGCLNAKVGHLLCGNSEDQQLSREIYSSEVNANLIFEKFLSLIGCCTFVWFQVCY